MPLCRFAQRLSQVLDMHEVGFAFEFRGYVFEDVPVVDGDVGR